MGELNPPNTLAYETGLEPSYPHQTQTGSLNQNLFLKVGEFTVLCSIRHALTTNAEAHVPSYLDSLTASSLGSPTCTCGNAFKIGPG